MFEINDGVCPGSAHSLSQLTDGKSRSPRLCRWAAKAANPIHASSFFTSCGWFSTSSRIGGSSCAGDSSTLGSSRYFSPINLDRPARRSIEPDSAFHRMSQINGALLHVSGSSRREFCWSAARHAQRRRFVTGLRPGKALPPAVTEAATSILVRGQACFSCRGVILIWTHNSDLIGLIPSRELAYAARCSIPKRDGIPAPLGVCKQEIYL